MDVAAVKPATLFLVNLERRRMRGVVSEGMLFDIGYADGLVPGGIPETTAFRGRGRPRPVL